MKSMYQMVPQQPTIKDLGEGSILESYLECLVVSTDYKQAWLVQYCRAKPTVGIFYRLLNFVVFSWALTFFGSFIQVLQG